MAADSSRSTATASTGKSQARRAQAESALAMVNDPLQLPRSGTCSSPATSGASSGGPGPGPDRRPGGVAVRHGPRTLQPLPTVRGRAIETAVRRDPRDYLDSDPGPDPQAVPLQGPVGERPRAPKACSSWRASGTTSSGSIAARGPRPRHTAATAVHAGRAIQPVQRAQPAGRLGMAQARPPPSPPRPPASSSRASPPIHPGPGPPAAARGGPEQRGERGHPHPSPAHRDGRHPARPANRRSGPASRAASPGGAAAAGPGHPDRRAGELEHPRAQRPRPPRREDGHRQGFRCRPRRLAGLVDRPARVRLPVAQTQSKPTFTDVVVFSAEPPRTHWACFAAGTPVHTIDGPRAIDQLQVGDRVLSQDTTTGALSFQPVVAIHHNTGPHAEAAPGRRDPDGHGDPPVLEGRRRAGSWPATSSPATPSAPSAARPGSNPSSPTRSSPSSTWTSPGTGISSWASTAASSTTSASSSRSTSVRRPVDLDRALAASRSRFFQSQIH